MTIEFPRSRSQRAPAPAKVRILKIANDFFYREGIRTVGIDKLISESSVTKATFYKHYRSKDILIVDYVNSRHDAAVTAIEELISSAKSPRNALDRWATSVVDEISEPGFRGCAFLNAAAEFFDPAHPVRRIIFDHRDWYAGRLADLMRSAGHTVPGDAADELVLARDGAMAGSYAGDPVAAIASFNRAVTRVLAEIS